MKKYLTKDNSPIKAIAIGAGVALGITVSLSFLMSLLSTFAEDPASLTAMLSLISLLVSGAVFGIVSRKVLGLGIVMSLLSAAISLVPMLISGLIIKGGMLGANVFLNYLAYLGLVVLFANIAGRLGHKKKYY